MRTVDEAVAKATPRTCFEVAANVERWPEILPHYRWVRFHRKEGFGRGTVEMAAWRSFPVFQWPTWWLSEMSADADHRRIHYTHVDGITRGMDVVWEVDPGPDDSTRLRIVHEWPGPSWPLIGGIAAGAVIGPHFISHIAGRTLDGVVRTAETLEGRA